MFIRVEEAIHIHFDLHFLDREAFHRGPRRETRGTDGDQRRPGQDQSSARRARENTSGGRPLSQSHHTSNDTNKLLQIVSWIRLTK